MSYPLAHKIIKPRGDWVPSANTDIRKTFERRRAALDSVRIDLTPEQKAEQEAYIKEHNLAF